MKTVSLSGTPRAYVGKKDAKKHRAEGKIPCVLYGGKEQIHFTADDKQFRKIIFTPEVSLVNLHIGDDVHETIIQDVQYHPVTDKILHVDFLQILPDKPVIIGVPVEVEGTAPGVLKGGRFITKMRKLKIKALAKDLPDSILLNISELDIGDSIKVSNVTRENITFLDSPNNVIVGVRTARTVVEEVPGQPAVEGAAIEGEKKEGEPEKK
ncbi:MAG: 50S ribosomal protein L25/general stress protein Ctc [Bacteroidetes bacterium]|nr:50S ribosomal protein L25/general stress protein Ctc [Bacteroidota bacterium]